VYREFRESRYMEQFRMMKSFKGREKVNGDIERTGADSK
jgi:hypothetical protein